MGFYPVAPATDEYVIGGPLFKKVTVELENGKKRGIQEASFPYSYSNENK